LVRVAPNGDIYAVRDVESQKNVVAKWEGNKWNYLPGQNIKDIYFSNSNDVFALRGARGTNSIIKWNGAQWEEIGVE